MEKNLIIFYKLSNLLSLIKIICQGVVTNEGDTHEQVLLENFFLIFIFFICKQEIGFVLLYSLFTISQFVFVKAVANSILFIK